jgi:hypothetical protein
VRWEAYLARHFQSRRDAGRHHLRGHRQQLAENGSSPRPRRTGSGDRAVAWQGHAGALSGACHRINQAKILVEMTAERVESLEIRLPELTTFTYHLQLETAYRI